MDGLVSGNGGGGNSYCEGHIIIYMSCYIIVVRRKGMFLYSAVSSPLDCSKSCTVILPWQTCSF